MSNAHAKVVRIDRDGPDKTEPKEAESESRSVFDPPKMPAYLKGAAKKHWKELVDNLMKHGLINELDAIILGMFCKTYARWLDLDQALDESGITQKTPNGYSQYTPEFTAWRDMTGQCIKLANQLGLTPPARIKMKAVERGQQDAFDF